MEFILILKFLLLFIIKICLSQENEIILPKLPSDDDIIDLSYFGGRIYGNPNEEVGNIVKTWEESGNYDLINPEELGTYAEGDILMPKSIGRNGILAETYRWPNGIVPFEIRGTFSPKELSLIEQAIHEYHKNTCIKFISRTSNDKDYITIQNSKHGCWSSVGKIGGQQFVNLQSPGCVYKIGTVIHELMHAIGFLHEQNREERDDFVTIQFQNVQKGTEANFEKAPKSTTTAFGVSYDYGSVMHYSDKAFSINGQPTIVPKQKTSAVMGQRDGFSSMDIEKIWKMYNCKVTTSSGGHKTPSVSSIEPLPNIVNELLNAVFSNGDEEEMQNSK